MLPKKEFLNFPFVLIIGFIILISGYLLFFTGIIDIKAAAGDLITSFDGDGIVVFNPSSGDDTPNATAIDSSGIYVVGWDEAIALGNPQWRIEKRSTSTGALVTSFDGDGIVQGNFSSTNDIANAIAIDSTYMYVAGYDMSLGSGNAQFHIEKRNLTTGALVTAFDGEGIVQSNFSSANDIANAIAIDSTYMYVAGYSGISGSNVQWYIEKRNLSNGALVTSFDGDGRVVSNPSSDQDVIFSIAIDSTYMYVAGYDSSPGSGNSQWRIEKRNLTTGALVTAFDGDGIVVSNPSSGGDTIRTIAVDSSGIYMAGNNVGDPLPWLIEKRNLTTGALITAFDDDGLVNSSGEPYAIAIDSTYMYVAGYDWPGGDWQWRIEKRNLSNGALVTSFDGDGIVTSNPTIARGDAILSIAVDSSGIYAVGYDSTPGNNVQWRIEKRSNTTTCTGPVSISWIDSSIIANSTKIRKVHVDELRSWIDSRRVDAGLSNYSWTDSSIIANSTKIRKIHMDEMRSAISSVYTTCGQSAPSWTDSTITANSTKIRKIHMDELRSSVSNAP